MSIIMDGENAWEHYPENAYYFLNALYRRLAEHPRLELTTFSDCLKDKRSNPCRCTCLRRVPGVYGTLSTWIGDPDKNRGAGTCWATPSARSTPPPVVSRAGNWRGPGCSSRCAKAPTGSGGSAAIIHPRRWPISNTSIASISTCLYQLLGAEPPEYLAQVFTHGRGAPAHGRVMRPGKRKLSLGRHVRFFRTRGANPGLVSNGPETCFR